MALHRSWIRLLNLAIVLLSTWFFFISFVYGKASSVPMVAPVRNLQRYSREPLPDSKEVKIARLKGPNVCPVRIPSYVRWQMCNDKDGKNKCWKSERFYYTRYQCCNGFMVSPPKMGCPKVRVKSKLTLNQRLQQFGLTRFSWLLKLMRLDGYAEKAANITVLAFVNDGNIDYNIRRIVKTKGYRQLWSVTMNHLIGGTWYSNDISNNLQLETLNPNTHRILRINFYSSRKVMSFTGALVIKRDVPLINGVMYIIDSMVTPPTQYLKSALKEHNEITRFKEAVDHLAIEFSAPVSVFAPTNVAFDELDRRNSKQNMLQNNECSLKLILSHITKGYIDISAMKNLLSPWIRTRSGNRISFRLIGNEVKMNGVTVGVTVLHLYDGVLYIIDKLLHQQVVLNVWDAAKTLVDLKVLPLFEDIGLPYMLSDNSYNYTIFLPSNRALSRIYKSSNDNKATQDIELDTALFHVTRRRLETKQMKNEMLIESMSKNRNMRINVYNSKMTLSAQGSCLSWSQRDILACNGVVHVIDHNVMQPAKGTIYDIILTDHRLTDLAEAVRKAKIEYILDSRLPLTMFAPTNDAIARLSKSVRKKLFFGIWNTRSFLLYHIVRGSIFSCVVNRPMNVKTLDGRTLRFLIGGQETFSVNRATVTEADIQARNGVIHLIDTVIVDMYKP